MSRLAAGAALCLLAAACTSLAPLPEVPEADAPAQWSRPGPGGTLVSPVPSATWWQGFGDPLLVDLVDRSTQAHASVQAAQAALRQARALRRVAEAARGPRVDGALGAQHGTSDGRSTGGSARVTLDASWETDLFGGLRSALRSAQATEAASAATLADVQRTVAAEVALA